MSSEAPPSAAPIAQEKPPEARRRVRYDLELFQSLNADYRDKPLVAAPRNLADGAAMARQASTRAGRLVKAHRIARAALPRDRLRPGRDRPSPGPRARL